MKFGGDRRSVVALVVFFIGLLSGNIGAEPLNIAVAANFNTCAKSLTRTFERETALSTRLLFASTGALYAQIYAPIRHSCSEDTASTASNKSAARPSHR